MRKRLVQPPTKCLCIWNGCEETMPINPMPPGWSAFLMYHDRLRQDTLIRDAVLCPTHTTMLDAVMFKRIR